jgi:diphthine synthase
MLYLIGLGLNENSLSIEALEAIKKSKIYLESYTVDFPYKIEELEEKVGKKIEKLGRKEVESDKLIKLAKKEDICLLVYGSPLFATTHISLINDLRKEKIKFKVIFNASVFDAVSLSGLELYKFGKITSLPDWKDKGKSLSFLDVVKANNSIKAHSLVLVDISLSFKDAVEELKSACEEKKIKLEKIVVCSCLGTSKEKIFYGFIEDISDSLVKSPFCFIIPGEMHFVEEESLKSFEV